MDWHDWGFAFFMADNERRLAKEEAEREQERLLEEYDLWCIDHGIPPPPRKEPEPEPYGCGCFAVALLVNLVVWGFVIMLLTTP